MARTLGLSQSVTGTLNGSGNGSVQMGPSSPGSVWLPQSVSVYMSGTFPVVSGSNTPLVSIYTGSASLPTNLVDATWQVLNAASSVINGQLIYPGMYIWAVWQNGNPNATVTLNVYGLRKAP